MTTADIIRAALIAQSGDTYVSETADKVDGWIDIDAIAKAVGERIEHLEAMVNELDFCQGEVIQAKILQSRHKGIVVKVERPKES